MKKLSFILVTFLISSSIFAQGSVSFGLKGGINIASTTNNETGGSSSRVGFHVGGLAHIHLNPEWAVQPEIVYSSQGGKYTVSDGEHQLQLNYINIPVLFQYMTAGGLRLESGPQLGFLTGVQDKRNGAETGFFTSDDFKKSDFSWAFGLGFKGQSGLGIDARYNLGVSNINNAGLATVRNSVFQFGLFYQFANNTSSRGRYRR